MLRVTQVNRSSVARWGPWLVLAALTLGPDPAQGARVTPAADFDALMAQGERHHQEGAHGDAARAFAAAYRSLPEDDQLRMRGEIPLELSLESYRAAYRAGGEEAMVEEPLVLLEGFVERRRAAARRGEASPVPSSLRLELERLRWWWRRFQDGPEVELEVEPGPAPPPAMTRPTVDEHPVEAEVEGSVGAKASVGIVVGGVAGVLGGVVLVAQGGRWLVELDRIDASQVGFLDADSVSQWSERYRRIATGMVVGGSVLAVAGVGLTAWGTVRLRRAGRRKRSAAMGAAWASPRQVEIIVTVEF